jgi:hypothetical protein
LSKKCSNKWESNRQWTRHLSSSHLILSFIAHREWIANIVMTKQRSLTQTINVNLILCICIQTVLKCIIYNKWTVCIYADLVF